ncbi:hypothetical protein L6R52_36065, partial [Myxococcota bacterium]|nr:hypothetical protein [Myxococcota bacterium]
DPFWGVALDLEQTPDGVVTGVMTIDGAAITAEGRIGARTLMMTTSDGRTLGAWVEDHRLLSLQLAAADGTPALSGGPFVTGSEALRTGRLPTDVPVEDFAGEYTLTITRASRRVRYDWDPIEGLEPGVTLEARVVALEAPSVDLLALEVTPPAGLDGGGPLSETWRMAFDVFWGGEAHLSAPSPYHHTLDREGLDLSVTPARVFANIPYPGHGFTLELEASMERR